MVKIVINRICIICSTLGTPCGIGDYTEDLARALDYNNIDVLLLNDIRNFNAIKEFHPDAVNIQFEYSLYSVSDLNRALNKLRRANIPCIITLHGWNDWLSGENDIIERKASRIIVTNERARRRLIERGNSPDKILVVPIGFRQFALEDRDKIRNKLRIGKDKKVIGLYGFFELWKGFDVAAKTAAILKHEYPDIAIMIRSFSKDYNIAKRAEQTFDKIIKENNIDIIEIGERNQYIPIKKVASALHACDVLIYPYQDLFTYSSSAAIRDGISSLVPIVATDITFFDDIPNNCILKIPTRKPRDFAKAISEVFESNELRERMIYNQRELIEKYSWRNIANIFIGVLSKSLGE